eukprot:TRINITY_DN40153_c0_g1_i1.p1 TRINITY_DN40153_c0_g1~~TRINITY_DN40153_c0_g1_i1.p1  ORF type:complete len:438 (+),score=62.90 TRINITY_DN40153_c0_g1_i1:99-1412(+)
MLVATIANLFGAIGMLTNCAFVVSSAPVLLEIRRRRSTLMYRFAPYLLQWTNCFSWAIYCIHQGPLRRPMVFACSLGGLGTTTAFLCVYAANITDILVRRSFYRAVPGAAILLAFLALLSFTEFPCVETDGHWCWWQSLCVLNNCLMFAGPALALRAAWRQRSAELIPLKLGLGSLLAAAPWVIYALFAGDAAVFTPNMVGVILGTTQVLMHQAIVAQRQREAVRGPLSGASAGAAAVMELLEQGKAGGGHGSSRCDLVADPWKQSLFTYGFIDAPQSRGMELLQLLQPGSEVELVDMSFKGEARQISDDTGAQEAGIVEMPALRTTALAADSSPDGGLQLQGFSQSVSARVAAADTGPFEIPAILTRPSTVSSDGEGIHGGLFARDPPPRIVALETPAHHEASYEEAQHPLREPTHEAKLPDETAHVEPQVPVVGG